MHARDRGLAALHEGGILRVWLGRARYGKLAVLGSRPGLLSGFFRCGGPGLLARTGLPFFLSHSFTPSLLRSLRSTELEFADVVRRFSRRRACSERALVPTRPRLRDRLKLGRVGRIRARLVPGAFAFGRDGDRAADDGLDRTEARAPQFGVEGDRHRPAAVAVANSKAGYTSIVWVTGDPRHSSRLSFGDAFRGSLRMEKGPRRTHRVASSTRTLRYAPHLGGAEEPQPFTHPCPRLGGG